MEPTASDLQAQLDRLSLTLQMGRDAKGNFEPASQQLSRLVDRCNEILNRWMQADEQHAHLVSEAEARLTEWGAIEHRLEHDYSERLRELQQTIEQEWQTLRRIHEEPVKQLRDEAAALSEVCVSAANLAVQGFERTQARLDAFEADLQTQLAKLSEDVQTALVESRTLLARSTAPAAPFPLEGVMRIHDDLRDGRTRDESPAGLAAIGPGAPEATARLSARVESLEREVTSERQEVRDTVTRAEEQRRLWRLAIGGLALVVIVDGVVGWMAQQRLNARLDEAATRVAAAERQAEAASTAANQQIAATRADADRQIAQFRQTALEAGIVANVLAAPDLIRFNLTGTDRAPRAYAQVLWSRSRGLVLSASQLPPAAEGSAYQIWLLSESGAASAGTISPDASGRATLAIENPPNLPRAVNGVSVTLESGGAPAAPSAAAVLVRVQQ
ncbi:MAG TPA: anti-sigma factor [Vicinamibacterales bacterium]|nr:anti-sigma factor [Vicinamibacterales bacterium]